MLQLVCKPSIYLFQTARQFAEEFEIGKEDLLLSNEYIYEPYFGALNLNATTIFLEKFGTGEPTDIMVEAVMAEIRKIDYRRIIAVGGGSVADVAKVLALKPAENVDELYQDAKHLEKVTELVIVPTTCGTGSEVTNISVINRTRFGTKLALISDALYADSAVLIPELLSNLPQQTFAASSIDALVHAIESSLSPKASAHSKLFGYRAIEMIIGAYQRIAAAGNTKESRIAEAETLLVASNFAGLAFGTAGCGAVHAMSYPLSTYYHVAHGESNYTMLIGILRNYLEMKDTGEICVLNDLLARLLGCPTESVTEKLAELLNRILPQKRLRDFGAVEADIEKFTQIVINAHERLLANSFVSPDYARVLKIYTELY